MEVVSRKVDGNGTYRTRRVDASEIYASGIYTSGIYVLEQSNNGSEDAYKKEECDR